SVISSRNATRAATSSSAASTRSSSVARDRDALRQAPPQLPRRRQPRRRPDLDQIRLDQHDLVPNPVATPEIAVRAWLGFTLTGTLTPRSSETTKPSTS